jgi:hypothetical protein
MDKKLSHDSKGVIDRVSKNENRSVGKRGRRPNGATGHLPKRLSPMPTAKALEYIFMHTNAYIAEVVKVEYSIVATWRYNFQRSRMTEEKKAEIINKFGFNLYSDKLWKSKQ